MQRRTSDQRVQVWKRSTKGLVKQHLINSFVYLVSGFRRFRKQVENCTKRVSNNFKLNDESTQNNKVFLIWSLPAVLSNYCLTNLRKMVKINRSYLPVAFGSSRFSLCMRSKVHFCFHQYLSIFTRLKSI